MTHLHGKGSSMIENVVFDLGGVLMHFDPIGFSRLFTDT